MAGKYRMVSRVPLAIVITLAVLGLGTPTIAAPKYKRPVEGPHIVVNVKSGAVLDDRDGARLWYPASTTKLMTAYVTFRAMQAGQIHQDTAVKISSNALAQPPSKMGFKVGTVLTVDNALKMIMVKSANDIAVALGEAVAGSEPKFIDRMNAEARRLGMSRTNYANPHGLPNSQQVTTARDLAVLARAILTEFPEFRSYLAIPAIKIGKKTLRNYNTLVGRYQGTTGMKTGFICASGFNLVASAKRGDKELIAVVLGEYSSIERGEKAAKLLDVGFRRTGLLGRTKSLNSVSSGSRHSGVYDMRPIICNGKSKAARAAAGAIPSYKKEANGVLMIQQHGAVKVARLTARKPAKSIRVYTGGAKGRRAIAPLPKPRPVMVADNHSAGGSAGDSGGQAPGQLTGAVAAPVKSAFAAMDRVTDVAGVALSMGKPDRRLPRPRPAVAPGN